MAKEEAIRVSELDSNFRDEIVKAAGGERIMRCFSCGDCTASCPVRGIDEKFNPRRIIRMALLGMKKRLFESDFIWLCTTCNSCQERCPQGVKVYEVMNVLKNLAVKEGYIHPTFGKQAELVGTSGRLYEIDDFDNRKRQKLGLPPVGKVFEDVKQLFELTGIDKIWRSEEEIDK